MRYGQALAALLTITAITALAACNGDGDGDAFTLEFSTFQRAGVVLGQADFSGDQANRGGPSAAADTLSGPYGAAALGEETLFVTDSANNRVLGYDGIPAQNGAAAKLVLGQPDFSTVSAGASATKMGDPETVSVEDGTMVVSSWANRRVLIYDSVPTSSGTAADHVVGHTTFTTAGAGACAQDEFEHLFSARLGGGRLIVSDAENNRVLIWNSVPTSNGAPADLVVGQGDFTHCARNDDDQDKVEDTSGPTARTLAFPSDAWSDGERLIVADSVNERVLIWETFPTTNFEPADVVVGQPDMTDDTERTTRAGLSGPGYLDVSLAHDQLFVADSSNNRVMIWYDIPTRNGAPADVVLGQGDFTHFTSNDDNQDGANDGAPTARTLSNPSGVYAVQGKLIVSDLSNNRVLVFQGE